MAARVLCAVLVLLMVCGIQAQTCPSGDTIETCVSSEMSAASPGTVPNTVLNIGFIYCAPLVGYGTGPISGLTSGTLTITTATGTITTLTVTGFTGSITTIAASGTNPFAPITSLAGVVITVSGGSTATITNNPAGPVYLNGANVPLTVIPSGQQLLGVPTQESCTAIRGDPLFSGFLGQQFYLGGQEGFVYNLLSTFNMELNGRLIRLDEGQAIYPYQQEDLRTNNAARMLTNPALNPMPKTVAWSHPGNYFSEVGVALVDQHRLYAQAGAFEHGWAKLTLDGHPLPVSDDYIVLGFGVNTTTLMRPSAHELMVRTVNVEFTLVNSDNFLNVDHVHLERGFRSHRHFAGILGVTVDSKWTWTPQIEEDSTVKSGNLFELVAQDM